MPFSFFLELKKHFYKVLFFISNSIEINDFAINNMPQNLNILSRLHTLSRIL